MSETTVWVGIYWERAVWDRARSAYVADLDSDQDSPGSFIGWLNRALEQHAARTPQQRSELAELTIERAAGRSFNKGHPLKQDVVDAMEDAIVTDRQELGRVVARSGFVKEAVLAAAQDARRRLGRELPPPPARLPNRPPRRTPASRS